MAGKQIIDNETGGIFATILEEDTIINWDVDLF